MRVEAPGLPARRPAPGPPVEKRLYAAQDDHKESAMGTISSSNGLISGLDIESIVTQLMQIESRPVDLLNSRIKTLTTQQTALMELQARVMALQAAAASFNKESVFQQKAVTSSNEDVLTATASQYATPGNYRFSVERLASAHYFVSSGYTSLDSSIGTGTISFEMGNGQLVRQTELSVLNGQEGFVRGVMTITDRTGYTAEVDLTTAMTVQDVLDAINGVANLNVEATVSGDQLIISDTSTDGTGTLEIAGLTAESLGIAGTADPGDPSRIVGDDILRITLDTAIGQLNDGNGVRGFGFGDDLVFKQDGLNLFAVDLRDKLFNTVGDPDASSTVQSLNGGAGVRLGAFRITDQNGRSVDIDLNELAAQVEAEGKPLTLGQVEQFIQTKIDEHNVAINSDYDPENPDTEFSGMMKIGFGFGSADHITLSDQSGAFATGADGERLSNFIVEDLNGGHAAEDMGIVADVDGSTISGERIWRMDTVGDMVNAINNHWFNYDSTLTSENHRLVTVALDSAGDGLTLDYHGSGSLTIDNTAAADDLGITATDPITGTLTGRRLIAGLNTVMLRSLQGGSANAERITEGSAMTLTDRAGNSATVDLTDAFTLQDVLEGINGAGTNIVASINATGNGIVLADTASTSGTAITVSGQLAEQLNVAVEASENLATIDSGNLQLQYISEANELSDLRQGQGVRLGSMKVTDADGTTATIDLDYDYVVSLQDVIDAFARSGTNLRARINDSGDGLLIYDDLSTAGGTIKIEEDGGSVAADLGILGQSAYGENFLDGSLEKKFEMGPGDTIEDLVERVNEADFGLKVSIINDGSSGNPYRISFVSQVTGRAGTVYVDAGNTSLKTQTLSAGQDALLVMGQSGQQNPIVISSSSNTIKDVIRGTTLELHAASSTPVDVTVADDLDGVVASIQSFVEAYNSLTADIARKDNFNAETLERSVLFGDSAVSRVSQTLNNLVTRIVSGLDSRYNSLSSIGVSFSALSYDTVVGEDGETKNYAVASAPTLTFDEEKFRAAFAEDPDAVAELFAKTDMGIGDYLAEKLENLGSTTTQSTLKNRLDGMSSQKAMFEDRIESLEILLGKKEERLYSQFYAMEQTLASLQSQQSTLSSLAGLISQ